MTKFLAIAVILTSFSFSCFADLVAGVDASQGPDVNAPKAMKTLDQCIQEMSKNSHLKIEPWNEKNTVLAKLRTCTENPTLEANDLVKDEIIRKADISSGHMKTALAGCLCYGKNPPGQIGGQYRLLNFVTDHPACVAMGGVRCI